MEDEEEVEAVARFRRESGALAGTRSDEPLTHAADALWVATTGLRRFSGKRDAEREALELLLRAVSSRGDERFARSFASSGCAELCLKLCAGADEEGAQLAWRVLAAAAAALRSYNEWVQHVSSAGIFNVAVTTSSRETTVSFHHARPEPVVTECAFEFMHPRANELTNSPTSPHRSLPRRLWQLS